MSKWTEDLYTRAFLTYGTDLQLNMAIEECSELIKELSKMVRMRNTSNDLEVDGSKHLLKENIAEEIADVQIMMEQVIQIYGLWDKVEMFRGQKLLRLKDRVDKDYHRLGRLQIRREVFENADRP